VKIARFSALVVAALAVLMAVPLALAAALPGGAKYAGQTADGGSVTVRLSGNGKSVKRMRIHYQVTCNDGQPRDPTYTDIVGAPLRRNGSFSGTGEYQGSVVKDTNRFKVSGKMLAGKGSGTFSLTATGSGSGSKVRCKTGKLAWSVKRQK
jgi:uncharacterized protein (DUF2147 family)